MYVYIHTYIYIQICIHHSTVMRFVVSCVHLWDLSILFMYVYTLIYIYVCTYVYLFIYIYIYIHVYIYACICIVRQWRIVCELVGTSLGIWETYAYISIWLYTYIHIYICMYIHIHVYMYIWIQVYIHTNLRMHIYIYIHWSTIVSSSWTRERIFKMCEQHIWIYIYIYTFDIYIYTYLCKVSYVMQYLLIYTCAWVYVCVNIIQVCIYKCTWIAAKRALYSAKRAQHPTIWQTTPAIRHTSLLCVLKSPEKAKHLNPTPYTSDTQAL